MKQGDKEDHLILHLKNLIHKEICPNQLGQRMQKKEEQIPSKVDHQFVLKVVKDKISTIVKHHSLIKVLCTQRDSLLSEQKNQ